MYPEICSNILAQKDCIVTNAMQNVKIQSRLARRLLRCQVTLHHTHVIYNGRPLHSENKNAVPYGTTSCATRESPQFTKRMASPEQQHYSHVEQDQRAQQHGDELPTYDDLAAQNGPNSRRVSSCYEDIWISQDSILIDSGDGEVG